MPPITWTTCISSVMSSGMSWRVWVSSPSRASSTLSVRAPTYGSSHLEDPVPENSVGEILYAYLELTSTVIPPHSYLCPRTPKWFPTFAKRLPVCTILSPCHGQTSLCMNFPSYCPLNKECVSTVPAKSLATFLHPPRLSTDSPSLPASTITVRHWIE